MTRKDYIKFAEMIQWIDRVRRSGSITVPHDTLELFKSQIIGILARDNPRFDRKKFLRACELGNIIDESI